MHLKQTAIQNGNNVSAVKSVGKSRSKPLWNWAFYIMGLAYNYGAIKVSY